ncbi:hypothetical protein KJ603_02175 [Patescibacteria group bacterium]|nr:hypothetical protein [Patescibacteria group bacterium]
MTEAIVLKINNINKKKVFISLIFALVFFSCSYIYLILQTTINISTYQDIKQEVIELDSQIGDHEFEYMSLKKTINLEMAQTLGYVEASNINFVDKDIVITNKLSLVD